MKKTDMNIVRKKLMSMNLMMKRAKSPIKMKLKRKLT